MADLNYHHLRYFWTIAHERHLTRAAERLHVSPSALSIQLRQLEERLGHALFERRGRTLELTEAGRIALHHADTIFAAGAELVSTLKGRPQSAALRLPPLRVGSVATLSRNFQLHWLRPLLARGDLQVVLHSGTLRELLAQLGAHQLDVVLANDAVPRDRAAGWHSTLLAQQPVSLISARPRGKARPFAFPADLQGAELLLPGSQGAVRAAFDRLVQAAGVVPRVLAEVDDMAMLRLLARETGALALVPPVVVADELQSGRLVERCSIPQLVESFYAITAERRFPHPLLREVMAAA
jgi:LysR family transcriptional activator of nhaA